ncbi:hypothetical protein AGMMS50276_16410 [Synergistales bacterium]|nr:hypothetical protein AGMMS50276_16410 [Synergistales bacterium]
MSMDEVTKYLSKSSVNAPFFLIVGDSNYASVKAKLLELGLNSVKVSDHCGSADKRPNLDNLMGTFDFADIDGQSRDKKLCVLGLGEYLALCGNDTAFTLLSKIKDMKIGNARVVLLLRGVSEVVQKLQAADPTRFNSRRVFFTDNTETSISIAFIPANLDLPSENGVKVMLAELENGKTTVNVKSNITFDNPLLAVSKIKSAYDGIKHIIPTFSLAECCGSNDQWSTLLSGITKANGDIDVLFDEFGSNPENDFVLWIKGNAYKNWLYFVLLKLKAHDIKNSYLRYVLEATTSFETLKHNVLNAIIDIQHTDERFDTFYKERKSLVEKFTESDIANFVSENRIDLSEGLYKLTNQTLTERQEFIALFSSLNKQTLLDRAQIAYPALSDYLWKYIFNDPKVDAELNTLFTDYFDRYKWQKALNAIDDDFSSKVEELAKIRVYTHLRSRNEVIGAVDKADTFLYWIDALGVEFLGFIQQWCKQEGLLLNIHIAQADLPTTTSVNKGFYGEWTGEKEKDERLDALKHKESGGYDYQHEKRPIHLARELDVITEVLDKAATKLAFNDFKRILIVSDHGASRLAVIKEQDEKYETDTKGEHSGRCCKMPPNYSPTEYDLPFATEGNGYLVLADYGRFKGSRAANVEVHGGASLEEVVIPIIELTLANPDTKVVIVEKTITANPLKARSKPATFTLFSQSTLGNVSIITNGKRYYAEKSDEKHHRIVTDITKSGEYRADVFDGDNLVGKITINVQSETGKKTAFDDLFND